MHTYARLGRGLPVRPVGRGRGIVFAPKNHSSHIHQNVQQGAPLQFTHA